MKVFKLAFLKPEATVPYLTGIVDKNIRHGYYGGIVAALNTQVKDAYYYDVNSAYPAAMCQPMPLGQPILASCSSLEGVFGFVKATVMAPDTTVNGVLPLPMRDENGVTVYQHGFISTG